MKVIISNTVILNTGDAAILFGIINVLKNSYGEKTEIVIYDKNPIAAKKYYPELTFKEYSSDVVSINLPKIRYVGRIFRNLNLFRYRVGEFTYRINLKFLSNLFLKNKELNMIRDYVSSDLIISTGGTYLVENYPLKERIFDLKMSRRLNKNFIFFTQSLGPYKNPYIRKSLKSIFENAKLIMLRDERSRNNIIDLGVKSPNLLVKSDAAFVMGSTEKVKKNGEKKLPIGNFKIAISVREWKFFEESDSDIAIANYKNSIREFVTHVVKKYDAEVTFLSTCQGIEEYWTDDSKFAKEIFDTLDIQTKKKVFLNRSFHNPVELMKKLELFDLVVSTRLHMAILSMNVGVPVIPIAYEFKTKELFEKLIDKNLILDIENITQETILNTFDAYINEFDNFKEQLAININYEITNSKEASQLLKDLEKNILFKGKH